MSPCEIHLSRQAIRSNFQRIHADSMGLALFPVVKANGYGHGANLLAKSLESDFKSDVLPIFCVAQMQEALELRRAGITREILVLSSFEKSDFGIGVKENISFVLSSERDVSWLLEQSIDVQKQSAVHLKFNTGMNRLGFDSRSYLRSGSHFGLRKLLQSPCKIMGLMSHLARSEDEPGQLSQAQADLFGDVVLKANAELAQHSRKPVRWVHLANSASINRGLMKGVANAGRPGLRLLGVYSDLAELKSRKKESESFQPILSIHARIRQLVEVGSGQGIGYGHRFVTSVPSLIGTLPIGYADGLHRRCSGTPAGFFSVLGEKAPIVGTISMDMTTIDLSRHSKRDVILENQKKGIDVMATWIGADLRAEEVAESLQTISYEVFCGLGSRPKRSLVE